MRTTDDQRPATAAATGAPRLEPVIRTVGLEKSFGANYVLRGIDLDFYPGTTTVILGGSGSGKSVFMKHLIGLLRPDAGSVFVDGQDITTLDRQKLMAVRAKFGMVFQWAALFDSMTVYENVAFPLREHRGHLSEGEIRNKVLERLALLRLEGAEHRYPSDLSGGMRKRVGLARALVLDPQIVLYDEPTTGLDPITTSSVDDMIKRAAEALGVTSVVISHDIASAFEIADRVAFLHGGKIVEQGSPREVEASKHEFVRQFLDTWFRRQ